MELEREELDPVPGPRPHFHYWRPVDLRDPTADIARIIVSLIGETRLPRWRSTDLSKPTPISSREPQTTSTGCSTIYILLTRIHTPLRSGPSSAPVMDMSIARKLTDDSGNGNWLAEGVIARRW